MKDYAPQYTKRERFILAAKIASWAVPLFIALKFWFLPWFKEYAEVAHCYDYGAFTGVHVVFYGLFAGLPLLFALIFLVLDGKKCLKIIKFGQLPIPGEKVVSPTKYVYGFKAKIRAYVFIVVISIFLGLGVQGYFWANDIIYNPNNIYPECKNS